MPGGQHMCAIVKELWLALTSLIEVGGQAVAESDVPGEMRFIYGVILREDTPLEICCLVAGLHQRAQREFCETTFSEVAAAFLQRCAEIVKRTGQKYATPDVGEIWVPSRKVLAYCGRTVWTLSTGWRVQGPQSTPIQSPRS